MRPIIIAAVPRSGSSLIAGIFHAHGVWVGNFHKKQMAKTPVYYDSFENIEIDNWFRDKNQSLIGLVETITPKDARWLYKCGPEKARIAMSELADLAPVLIRVTRKIESIVASSADFKAKMRCKQMANVMSMIGPLVDSDAVISRDFTSLKNAIEHAGLKFDPELAEKQIDNSLWHHY